MLAILFISHPWHLVLTIVSLWLVIRVYRAVRWSRLRSWQVAAAAGASVFLLCRWVLLRNVHLFIFRRYSLGGWLLISLLLIPLTMLLFRPRLRFFKLLSGIVAILAIILSMYVPGYGRSDHGFKFNPDTDIAQDLGSMCPQGYKHLGDHKVDVEVTKDGKTTTESQTRYICRLDPSQFQPGDKTVTGDTKCDQGQSKIQVTTYATDGKKTKVSVCRVDLKLFQPGETVLGDKDNCPDGQARTKVSNIDSKGKKSKVYVCRAAETTSSQGTAASAASTTTTPTTTPVTTATPGAPTTAATASTVAPATVATNAPDTTVASATEPTVQVLTPTNQVEVLPVVSGGDPDSPTVAVANNTATVPAVLAKVQNWQQLQLLGNQPEQQPAYPDCIAKVTGWTWDDQVAKNVALEQQNPPIGLWMILASKVSPNLTDADIKAKVVADGTFSQELVDKMTVVRKDGILNTRHSHVGGDNTCERFVDYRSQIQVVLGSPKDYTDLSKGLDSTKGAMTSCGNPWSDIPPLAPTPTTTTPTTAPPHTTPTTGPPTTGPPSTTPATTTPTTTPVTTPSATTTTTTTTPAPTTTVETGKDSSHNPNPGGGVGGSGAGNGGSTPASTPRTDPPATLPAPSTTVPTAVTAPGEPQAPPMSTGPQQPADTAPPGPPNSGTVPGPVI